METCGIDSLILPNVIKHLLGVDLSLADVLFISHLMHQFSLFPVVFHGLLSRHLELGEARLQFRVLLLELLQTS